MGRAYTDVRLDNGLRVVVAEDPVAPVAAVNVAYGAGTRCEGPGEGELAHLFEHLMFEGSARVGPGEHVALVAATGGMVEGTTQADCTTYASVVPNHCVELVLWLEAERLGSLPAGLTAESLERQRAVVRNEHRQRRGGVPYGSALADLTERLFPPGYAYHTSMARRTELEGATLGTVTAFFRHHYVPANAVVAVTGDVDTDDVLRWAKAYLGAVPAAPAPARAVATALAPLGGEVRDEVVGPVPQPRAYLAWRGPADGTPEYDALLVAVAILAAGEGSLLRGLVRDDPDVVDAGLTTLGHAGGPSVVHGFVAARSAGATEAVEARYRATVELLAGAGPRETTRAARVLECGVLQQAALVGGRAHGLAVGALLHDRPYRLYDRPAELAAVTPARVRAVAAEVFRADNRVVRTFLPGEPS